MKIRFINILTLFVAVILLFVSCKSENSASEKGLLSVSAFNSDKIVVNSNLKPETKSLVQASDDYKVVISQILTGEVAYATTYGTVKSSSLAIEQGVYRVSAYNIDVQNAQWDTPRYGGHKDVTVKAGQNAVVAIECHMTNVKVTVEITDLLASVFDVTSVIVSDDNGGALEFVGNSGRAGYFVPSNFNVTVVTKKKSDGTIRTVNYSIDNAEAATWYKVKVNLKLFANTGFDIVVDSDVFQEHNTEVDPLL